MSIIFSSQIAPSAVVESCFIELHAPTSSTQKLKLMRRGGQFTYIPTLPLSLSWWGEVGNSLIFQHSPSRGGSLRPQTWNRSEQQLFYLITLTRIRTRDLWLRYHIELNAPPTSSTQKLKLMGRGEQFTYIPTLPLIWRLPQTSDVE